jgi:hypothetical protein
MSWTRLDDGTADHPKFVSLNDAGWSLWIRALIWSSKHKTEGVLDPVVVDRLGGRRKVIRDLVHRRLWDVRPGGAYQIHDFLDYNPDRHGTRPPPSPELRAARAAAGKRGADSRWHGNADSSGNGKSSPPPIANEPSAMAPIATPGIPDPRIPEKKTPERPKSGWSKAGDLASALRGLLPDPDPEPSR